MTGRLQDLFYWFNRRSIPIGNLRISADHVSIGYFGKKPKQIVFYFGDISDNTALLVNLSEENFAFLELTLSGRLGRVP